MGEACFGSKTVLNGHFGRDLAPISKKRRVDSRMCVRVPSPCWSVKRAFAPSDSKCPDSKGLTAARVFCLRGTAMWLYATI